MADNPSTSAGLPGKSVLDAVARGQGLPRLSLIESDPVFIAKSYMLAYRLAEDPRIPPRQRIALGRYTDACITLMQRRPVTPAAMARAVDGETWNVPPEGRP
jgi:hypothetical protein